MGASDPQLAAALQNDPQAAQQALAMAAAGGMPGGMPGGGMPGGGMPGGGIPELSDAEKEAVDRLVALGYDRGMVLEVYLGCGKDENLAANILMDEGSQ